jgi:hypothetical protein
MSNDDVIKRGGGSPQARAAYEAGIGGSSLASDYDDDETEKQEDVWVKQT